MCPDHLDLIRAEVLAGDEVAIVHVMSRVIRRGSLLGDDPVTGRNYDHRKMIIENQLQRLVWRLGYSPANGPNTGRWLERYTPLEEAGPLFISEPCISEPCISEPCISEPCLTAARFHAAMAFDRCDRRNPRPERSRAKSAA